MEALESTYERGLHRVTNKILRGDPERRAKKVKLHRYGELVFRRPAEKLIMADQTRTMLTKLYRPHIADLEDLLGRRIDAWR